MESDKSLKKKIIFRSSHRGTKEMDILLNSFVKKHINCLNTKELKQLERLLDIEDDIIYSWYMKNESQDKIDENSLTLKLKNFKL